MHAIGLSFNPKYRLVVFNFIYVAVVVFVEVQYEPIYNKLYYVCACVRPCRLLYKNFNKLSIYLSRELFVSLSLAVQIKTLKTLTWVFLQHRTPILVIVTGRQIW